MKDVAIKLLSESPSPSTLSSNGFAYFLCFSKCHFRLVVPFLLESQAYEVAQCLQAALGYLGSNPSTFIKCSHTDVTGLTEFFFFS